jgi:glycosyltransferase involved in cell wall biosynthesis
MPVSSVEGAAAAALPVTVAISTLGEGIARIRLPEPAAGISYLVLLQRPQPGAADFFAGRGDVRLELLDTIGLSNSRNAALERAADELLLFADDDVTLEPEGIRALAAHFAADPGLALAAGWRAGRLPQDARAHALTRLNSGRICAPEFMVRRPAVQAAGVAFDLSFGLGARHGIGEDYIFVCDILGAGLKGVAVPVATGSHPHESTGDNWADPALLAARRAVIARVFGPWAGLVRLSYALKHRKKFTPRRRIWGFLWGLRT